MFIILLCFVVYYGVYGTVYGNKCSTQDLQSKTVLISYLKIATAAGPGAASTDSAAVNWKLLDMDFEA
ncbi:hypothetical protein QL285_053176 [Trifolium repens]|nr:hypothetical protein QL285_053176 [Trifolium repens]